MKKRSWIYWVGIAGCAGLAILGFINGNTTNIILGVAVAAFLGFVLSR